MTTVDYTYPIGSLLLGLSKRTQKNLNDEEKEVLQNNIGVLSEMAQHVTMSAGYTNFGKNNTAVLCHTASFLNELIGEVNGLLQE